MHAALRLLSVAAFATCLVHDAHAAESYDSCAGTIATVPATISTQGTWCLKADKSWSYTSGTMVTIATNNVTIDCNYYKLGGNGGGPATVAIGIQATGRSNITIRNCNVRGFAQGIVVSGDGAIVEDNILDGSRLAAIQVSSDGGAVRRNRVVDTGVAGVAQPAGIIAGLSTDVVDNVVENVIGVSPVGISVNVPSQGLVDGNRVRGIDAGTAGIGIYVDPGSRMLVRGNHVVYGLPGGSVGPGASKGISCNAGPKVSTMNNVVMAWPFGIDCTAHASNIVL